MEFDPHPHPIGVRGSKLPHRRVANGHHGVEAAQVDEAIAIRGLRRGRRHEVGQRQHVCCAAHAERQVERARGGPPLLQPGCTSRYRRDAWMVAETKSDEICECRPESVGQTASARP